MRIENFKVEVDFLLLRPQRRVTFSQRPGSRVHIGSCIFLGGPYVLGLCRTLNPHLVLGDHFPVCTFFSESRVLCLSFLTLHRKLQGLLFVFICGSRVLSNQALFLGSQNLGSPSCVLVSHRVTSLHRTQPPRSSVDSRLLFSSMLFLK